MKKSLILLSLLTLSSHADLYRNTLQDDQAVVAHAKKKNNITGASFQVVNAAKPGWKKLFEYKTVTNIKRDAYYDESTKTLYGVNI